MTEKLEIKQRRSVAGASENQRRILKALGLRHREQVVVHDDSPSVWGMIRKVMHMVDVVRRGSS